MVVVGSEKVIEVGRWVEIVETRVVAGLGVLGTQVGVGIGIGLGVEWKLEVARELGIEFGVVGGCKMGMLVIG
jgi:hypothetical protein